MKSPVTIAVLATALVAASCAPSGGAPASPQPPAAPNSLLPSPTGIGSPLVAPSTLNEQPKTPTPEQLAMLESEFRKACVANSDGAQRLTTDLNGDGQADKLCWRNYSSAEAGDGAQLLFEVGGRDEYVDLTLKNVIVKVEPWSASSNKDYGLDKSPGPIVVIVSDGDTDPLMLFWQDDDGSGKPGVAIVRL